jgi:hypothetical protein
MTVYRVIAQGSTGFDYVPARSFEVGERILLSSKEVVQGFLKYNYPIVPGDLGEDVCVDSPLVEGNSYVIGEVNVHLIRVKCDFLETPPAWSSSEEFRGILEQLQKTVYAYGVVRKAGIIKKGDAVEEKKKDLEDLVA